MPAENYLDKYRRILANEPNALDKYLGRVSSDFYSGLDQSAQGVGDIVERGNYFTGVPRIALGGLGWFGSPVSAAVSPIIEPVLGPAVSALDKYISQPVEEVTGYPHDLTTQLAMAMIPGRKGTMKPASLAEGITAYHASPHKFDKFNMSKIGTGEGAQAYGKGLYFAESPEVSGRGGAYDLSFTRKRIEDSADPAPHYAAQWLENVGGNREAAAAKLEAHIRKFVNPQYTSERTVKGYNDALALLRSKEPIGEPARAHIYEVRLRLSPSEIRTYEGPMGAEAEAFAKQAQASGAKAVRYPDANSRLGEGGETTYNYVVFDDKIIDILKRYGIPLTVGVGGAVTVAGQNMPPEIAQQLEPEA